MRGATSSSVGQASGSAQKGPASCHTFFQGRRTVEKRLLVAGWARAFTGGEVYGAEPELGHKKLR